jgi:phenylalanyl-tRNA synthetase beta chain
MRFLEQFTPMKASHDWLRAFVPHALPADEVARLISAHVATLEGSEALRADLAPFVVGQVVHSEPIPETRLSFNSRGRRHRRAARGGVRRANVVVGHQVSRSPGRHGRRAKGGCASSAARSAASPRRHALLGGRAGLGADADGILPLDTDAAPGTPILRCSRGRRAAGARRAGQPPRPAVAARPRARAVGAHGRAARRAARSCDGAAALPPVVPAREAQRRRRHRARRGRRGVPAVLRRRHPRRARRARARLAGGRLAGVGARSINNVVDATNYALHGLGQPMHAFDCESWRRARRRAPRRDGERLTTLDGQARARTIRSS